MIKSLFARPVSITLAPIFLIFVLLIPPTFVNAATKASDFDRLINRLQQHYDATSSFSANFKQNLTSAGGSSRQRSGKIYYQKPGKLRWEFASPQAETIVSDGTTLFDFDPDLNQVVEMPLKDAFHTQSAASFFLGIGNLQHDFIVEPLKSDASKAEETLVLRPKDGSDKLDLTIDNENLNITGIRITDTLGNINLIDLSDLQRNISLNPALFHFTPPPDADIVTAPKHR